MYILTIRTTKGTLVLRDTFTELLAALEFVERLNNFPFEVTYLLELVKISGALEVISTSKEDMMMLLLSQVGHFDSIS